MQPLPAAATRVRTRHEWRRATKIRIVRGRPGLQSEDSRRRARRLGTVRRPVNQTAGVLGATPDAVIHRRRVLQQFEREVRDRDNKTGCEGVLNVERQRGPVGAVESLRVPGDRRNTRQVERNMAVLEKCVLPLAICDLVNMQRRRGGAQRRHQSKSQSKETGPEHDRIIHRAGSVDAASWEQLCCSRSW